MKVMKRLPFTFTDDFLEVYESLNSYERSEVLKILNAMDVYKLDAPEMLVELEDDNEVRMLDENEWIITSKNGTKQYQLKGKINHDSSFLIDSLKLKR